MHREALRKLGLTEEEITIYLTLLKKRSAKATVLAKELNLARSTVYRFLDSLLHKGLVSENYQDNVKHFFPVEPERIPEILEERIEEIRLAMPQLQAIKKDPLVEANVELYRGIEGIKSVMRDILREADAYTFIGEVAPYLDFETLLPSWVRAIEKRKIHGRIVCPVDDRIIIAPCEEFKLLPREVVQNMSTWTFNDKTVFIIWDEPLFAIVITSQITVENHKKVFEYFWKIAKKPTKAHRERCLFKMK